MDPGRHPTPGPFAVPAACGQRPKPDSENPQPLGEAILLTTPSGEHTLTAGRVIIGRAPTCQIVIQDPLVSRQHALIRIKPTEVLVEDLRSANGVYVNNVRVSEPHRLCDGDRILVGTQELCVFALSSRRGRTLRRPRPDAVAEDVTDSVPSTERVDIAPVLARAAQRMLDQGAPREAEQILEEHLRKILASARSGLTFPPTVYADAARLALALATDLGSGRWFDYAVELHYRAGLCMSIEIAAALAEAALAVSEVDRVGLARYVMWLHANGAPSTGEREVVLCCLESLKWRGR